MIKIIKYLRQLKKTDEQIAASETFKRNLETKANNIVISTEHDDALNSSEILAAKDWHEQRTQGN